MPLPTLPSKLEKERVRVGFDFTALLDINETISSWSVIVEVATGTATDTEDMVATRRFLDGAIAYQWFIVGTPGVTYNLICVAQTSDSRELRLERRLAIVRSPELYPPLFGITLSSTLYPVFVYDAYDSSEQIVSGILKKEIVEYFYEDAYDSVGVLVSGTLRAPIAFYTATDAYDSYEVIASGTLRTPVVPYMYNEAYDSFTAIMSGSMPVVVVATSFNDAYDSYAVIQSGTLA